MALLPGNRIRNNGITGTTTNDPLTNGAATLESANLAKLGVVSGDHAIITLDPLREVGEPEIVMVTAHTASSTSATIQRGMYGTTARQHPVNTLWVHAATTDDFSLLATVATRPTDVWKGQTIFESDTLRPAYYNGTQWLPGSGVIVCTSATRPSTPFTGQHIYETDTGRAWAWSGAVWQVVGPKVPCVRVRANTTRAATNGAWGTTTFDVADEDNWGQWSAGNPGRITCQLTGVYDIQGHCAFTGAAGQSRGIGLRKNLSGANGPNLGTHLAATNPSWSCCIPISANSVRLVAGDYVELASLANAAGINLILEDGGVNLAWTYQGA